MTPAQQKVGAAAEAHPILFRTFQNLGGSAAGVVADLARTSPRYEINLEELLQIGRAKLFKVQDVARIERNLGANSDAEVRAASRLAFSAEEDHSAIAALTGLNGVKVAVGSAILAWCFPDRWAVIDRHAWRALTEFGVLPSRRNSEQFRIPEYVEYCRVLRPIATQLGRSPQQLDAWLFSFGKCGLSSDDV